MINAIANAQLPNMEITFDNQSERNELAKIPDCQPCNISELQTVTERMVIEFQKHNEKKKRDFRNEIMRELNGIKEDLRGLLDTNEKVTEIEQLNRDEFVIDITKKNKLEK